MVQVAREAARKSGIDEATFVVGDWEVGSDRRKALGTLASRPKFATCVSAFHYFSDPVAAARHVREALEPGGSFFVVDRALDASMATVGWGLVHRFLVRDQVRFYRIRELVSIFREAGFEHVEVLTRVNEWFWKGKLHTSLVFIAAKAPLS